MSKTKQELVDSLRKAFSKNDYLKGLLKEIKKTDTRAEGLKKIRREYPFIYDDVIEFMSHIPEGEEM